MRVLIVFDHPYLQSYCAAMMAAVQQGAADGGHEVEVIDLYRDGFAPVMSIEELEGYA